MHPHLLCRPALRKWRLPRESRPQVATTGLVAVEDVLGPCITRQVYQTPSAFFCGGGAGEGCRFPVAY